MRRNEGRVVNTHLVFKKDSFQGRKKSPGERERTEGEGGKKGKVEERWKRREEKTGETERKKRAESGIGVKKTMNAGGVENGL
ncbi:hypothetical protein TNCV_2241401 [Trichonephila clavipes]|nr:hypothetical protein TNCV_2241401 [Trichonephila clavipes]